jgi:hypothetical protein
VNGSRFVDAIAYTRIDPRTISAIGKQKGSVSLRHTSTLSPEGDSYTMSLSLYSGEREIATGTLVFGKP